MDAITAVVGGKADATFVRSGAERALVEATFRLPPESKPAIHEILEREDLLDDPDYVTLSREIRREGRSTARVNGRTVSLSLARELGSYLVDIHGQSEHLSLLTVRQHLNLLDRYAAAQEAQEAYRAAYQRLLDVRRELTELRHAEQDAGRRTDLLSYQLDEIELGRPETWRGK